MSSINTQTTNANSADNNAVKTRRKRPYTKVVKNPYRLTKLEKTLIDKAGNDITGKSEEEMKLMAKQLVKEHKNNYGKLRYKKNREVLIDYQLCRYHGGKQERLLEYQKERYHDNKQPIIDYQLKYYQRNKEAIKKYNNEKYHKNHPNSKKNKMIELSKQKAQKVEEPKEPEIIEEPESEEELVEEDYYYRGNEMDEFYGNYSRARSRIKRKEYY
jgi:hypothetical protein